MTPEETKAMEVQAKAINAAQIAASAITKTAVKEYSKQAAETLGLRKSNKVGNDDYAAILAGAIVKLAPHAIKDAITFKVAFSAVWAGFPKSPSAALQEWLKEPAADKATTMADKYMSV